MEKSNTSICLETVYEQVKYIFCSWVSTSSTNIILFKTRVATFPLFIKIQPLGFIMEFQWTNCIKNAKRHPLYYRTYRHIVHEYHFSALNYKINVVFTPLFKISMSCLASRLFLYEFGQVIYRCPQLFRKKCLVPNYKMKKFSSCWKWDGQPLSVRILRSTL